MKIGKNSISFNDVYVYNTSSQVGPKEGEGPLGKYFDTIYKDEYIGQQSWEKSEMMLLDNAIKNVINKSFEPKIDCLISGDLVNQMVVSNYVARNYDFPFIGVYGACSTSVLGIIMGSMMIDDKNANMVITSCSSHNLDAERQFRYPTEYGGAKPNTATTTVTGASATILSNIKTDIRIEGATIGRVIDANVNNPNDMGSAMAPAAYETIKQHFIDFNRTPNDYDLIITGDLSLVGKPILIDLLKQDGYDIEKVHYDAGLMIYDLENQEVHSGGSGCACMGVVLNSYVMDLLKKGKVKRVLAVATGALLNPLIMNQNETIPSISHAISIIGGVK